MKKNLSRRSFAAVTLGALGCAAHLPKTIQSIESQNHSHTPPTPPVQPHADLPSSSEPPNLYADRQRWNRSGSIPSEWHKARYKLNQAAMEVEL